MVEEQNPVAVTLEEQSRRVSEEWKYCLHLIAQDAGVEEQGPHCNRTWDGIMCWPRTRAGDTAEQSCPSYVHRFVPSGRATKRCLEDGEWYHNPQFNRTWTNYTLCYGNSSPGHFNFASKGHLQTIKVIYNVGYGVSLITLTVAIVLMIYFRRLHCPRNTVHINLFLAYVLRAMLSFLRDNLLVHHLGLPNDIIETAPGVIVFNDDGTTHWQCKLLFAVFNYMWAASGMWIFVEGLYLHTLIIVAVFSERKHIRYYILLGWGGPLFFILPWVILRATVEDEYCWNTHPTMAIFWILKGPMLITVLVNFVFFVNIVRVLFTKLVKTAPPRARRFRYRRLAKSTLVLIPVFGLHYILFLGLPEKVSPAAELVKLYYEMFFNSFQGFFVACLFCFMNREVKAEIRKKWIRYKLRTNSRKFQKIYWQTSSSHLSRKRHRRLSGNNHHHHYPCFLDKRGGGARDANSSSSDSPMQRHRFHVNLHQMRYIGRHPGHIDPAMKEDVRAIIFTYKKSGI